MIRGMEKYMVVVNHIRLDPLKIITFEEKCKFGECFEQKKSKKYGVSEQNVLLSVVNPINLVFTKSEECCVH